MIKTHGEKLQLAKRRKQLDVQYCAMCGKPAERETGFIRETICRKCLERKELWQLKHGRGS